MAYNTAEELELIYKYLKPANDAIFAAEEWAEKAINPYARKLLYKARVELGSAENFIREILENRRKAEQED